MNDIRKYKTDYALSANEESREVKVDAGNNTAVTIATKVSTPTDAPVYSYPAKASYKYQAAAADNVVVSAGPATLLAILLGDNVANASIEISDHASDGDGNIVALPAGGAGTDDLLTQSLASKFNGVITFGPNGMFCATGITCDQIAQTKCTYIYLTY